MLSHPKETLISYFYYCASAMGPMSGRGSIGGLLYLSQPVGLCEEFWKLPPELSLDYLCYAAWLGIQVGPEACTQVLLCVPPPPSASAAHKGPGDLWECFASVYLSVCFMVSCSSLVRPQVL